MLILFLCGILLYIIWLPVENNSGYEKNNTQNTGIVTNTNTVLGSDTLSYQDRLEAELKAFLEIVDGVGDVEVLIYLEASEEYVVEKDHPIIDSVSEDNGTDGGSSMQQEREIDEETVYTVNSNGDEVPFVTQTKNPKIAGIVIAAQGAENEAVKLRITKMAMALYGVEANKIDVLSMKNN